MRQTSRAAAILSLFLLSLTGVSAEPVIRGFFVEKLPTQATTRQLAPGKSLVLAHVFNTYNKPIKAGEYEIGIEIENSGKIAKFALKPRENISPYTIKTFRMAIPVSDQAKVKGNFRVFSKIDGKIYWSETYSFLQGVHSSGDDQLTTLYTEAPPEPDAIRPPEEIRFENEVIKKHSTKDVLKNSKTLKESTKNFKTVTSAPVKVATTKSTEHKASFSARVIDPSEFKRLRTIDEELVIYVIKEGDTLKSIAEKYYGSPSKERTIADLNFIENPSSIKVGEEIIVDVKPLSKSEIKKSQKSNQALSADKKTYTIQKGDTLSKIAKQLFGKSSDAKLLLKANPRLNPNKLKIGDVIIIPQNRGDNV